MGTDKIDLFMPTFNRLEYTKIAVESLFSTTDARLVTQFIVVDGNSDDGTTQYLEKTLGDAPFKSRLIRIRERHVVHAMQAARDACQTPIVAKLDSDTVACPDWLPISLDVLNRHPDVWALGIGAGESMVPWTSKEPRSYLAAKHVGGVGLFRRKAWEGLMPETAPYHGWTTHQWNSPWKKGWLMPNLPIFLLDQLPFEPFVSLRSEYFNRGWHRTRSGYRESQEAYWTWKFPDWRKPRAG